MRKFLKRVKARFPHETETYKNLTIEVKNHIGYICMNRSSAHIDADFLTELVTAHEALEYNEEVHGVIWHSAADGIFLDGFDVASLEKLDALARLRLFRHLFDATRRLYIFSKPELVLMRGSASAAGGVLVATADWRFLGDNRAIFSFADAMPGIDLPKAICQMIASAIGDQNPQDFLRTGSRGADAVRSGFAHELTSPENLLYRGEALMRRIILNPTEFVRARKVYLRRKITTIFEQDQSLNDRLLSAIEADMRIKDLLKVNSDAA